MDMRVAIPEGKLGSAEIVCFSVSKDEARWANFRGRGRNITPGKYTKILINNRLVMSDTPSEQSDHSYAVHQAKGSVLIMGLGIGMVVAACLKKPEVTDITVIELNPDVITLVGTHLKDARLTIIQADAMTWKPPKGKHYGMVWHDIWPDICSDNLKQMATLTRRYARKADWQGCWCKAECKYQQRQDSRRYY